MTNPRDPASVEELQAHSKSPLEVHVAIEPAIEAALKELDEDVLAIATDPATDGETTVLPPTHDWEALWTPSAVQPEALMHAVGAGSGRSDKVRLATFPGLSRVLEGEMPDTEAAIDESTLVRRLQEARHRDHVAELLLRFAVGLLHRCCIFRVHKGEVVGWMARGQSVVVDDVQSFTAAVENPSVFHDIIATGEHYSGPLGPGRRQRDSGHGHG